MTNKKIVSNSTNRKLKQEFIKEMKDIEKGNRFSFKDINDLRDIIENNQ